MAIRAFRIKNSLHAAGWQDSQETDITPANGTPGWTVGKTAATRYAQFQSGTKVAATFFQTSALPDAPQLIAPDASVHDCWILTDAGAAFNGSFDASAWEIAMVVRETTSHAGVGRIRVRVWAATNTAATTGLRELTGAVQLGSSASSQTTTVDGTSTVTWSPGAITLTAEYLFVQVAWEILTAGGANGGDVVMRVGDANVAGTGTRVRTADYTAGAAAASLPHKRKGLAMMERSQDRWW